MAVEYFSDVPFTTAMVIGAHEEAFRFIGGLPREIVYDQDRLLMVSENLGDIVPTSEPQKSKLLEEMMNKYEALRELNDAVKSEHGLLALSATRSRKQR